MRRRTFLRATGAASVGGLATLAGCLGSSPPPRKSNVIPDVELADAGLVVDVADDASRWVETRRNVDVQQSAQTNSVAASRSGSLAGAPVGRLAPVGTATAQKGGGGRGASGRGSGGFRSAPRSRNGRAWLHATDDDDEWYEEHDDETTRVPVDVRTIGFAYLGSNPEFREQPPGPGPVSWDQTFDDPGSELVIDLASFNVGWYRVGSDVVTDADAVQGDVSDLGWECVDLRVEGAQGSRSVTERWKVSPQI